MKLKLRVRFNDVDRRYYPSYMFSLNSFANLYDLKAILAEIHEYVNSHDVSLFVVNKNEVHFMLDDKDGKLVNLGPTIKIDFNIDDLEDHVFQLTGLSREEVFNRSRKRERCIPRFVIFCALAYFGGRGYSEIGERYGYVHASVMNGVKKAIPSAIISGDTRVIPMVNALAERYGDEGFKSYCGLFNKVA